MGGGGGGGEEGDRGQGWYLHTFRVLPDEISYSGHLMAQIHTSSHYPEFC